jgi:hypothetical protein
MCKAIDDTTHQVESSLKGYVEISHSPHSGNGGIGFGMYSRTDPDSIRDHYAGSTVTNVKRARHIARNIHGWEIPSEDQIVTHHLHGT